MTEQTHMNYCLRVLEDQGYKIGKDAVIVDFGCGAGRSITELRKQGYNAMGCDVPESLAAHGGNERTAKLRAEGLILPIETSPYRLPFADGGVDYIFSETVFEHVRNIDETVAELARVLKPGGASFHHFPSKYSVIEQHRHVPFGGVITSYPYVWFGTALGLRKYHQKNMPAAERARSNVEFVHNETYYRSANDLRSCFGRHFPKVVFAEDSYFRVTDSRKSKLLGRLGKAVPGIGRLYRTFWANALVAAK